MATVAQLTHLHHAPSITEKDPSCVAPVKTTTRQPAALIRDTPFARDTYVILHKTLFTILRERGRSINGHGTQGSMDQKTAEAWETLIRLCREFMEIHGREADRGIGTLNLSIPMLHQTYHEVAEDMFEEDINWGRIIAFISFTIAVAEKVHDTCSDSRSKQQIVENIETWLNAFFFNRLQDWITTSAGGWGGLSNKFRPEKVNRSSNKDGSTSGQWLTLTAFGVAGALVTAFLAR